MKNAVAGVHENAGKFQKDENFFLETSTMTCDENIATHRSALGSLSKACWFQSLLCTPVLECINDEVLTWLMCASLIACTCGI